MRDQFDLELFEKNSHQNGFRFWIAHTFMALLGYESWSSFKNVINKAMSSCARLDIDVSENFVSVEIIHEGKTVKTFKLTRFACFLITMHADSR